RQWRAVGRDPAPGVVIAQYEPPKGQSPADLRFIQRMGHDSRCFAADLLALAVAGHVRIERDKGLLTDDWTLVREPREVGGGTLPASQATLLSHLFPGTRTTLALQKSNAKIMQKAQSAHTSALAKRHSERMFKHNSES